MPYGDFPSRAQAKSQDIISNLQTERWVVSKLPSDWSSTPIANMAPIQNILIPFLLSYLLKLNSGILYYRIDSNIETLQIIDTLKLVLSDKICFFNIDERKNDKGFSDFVSDTVIKGNY